VSVPTPQVASQGQLGNAQTDIQTQKKEVQQAKPDAGMYGCVRFVFCYLATMILLWLLNTHIGIYAYEVIILVQP